MYSELLLAVRLAVGLVFLMSGSTKLRNPIGFAQGVSAFGILPRALAPVFGLFVILAEISIACVHLTGRFIKMGSIFGITLLALFLIAVAKTLVRKQRVKCNCFGRSSEYVSTDSVFRLLFLILGEGIVLSAGSRGAVIDPYLTVSWVFLLFSAGCLVTQFPRLLNMLLLDWRAPESHIPTSKARGAS
jgi:uncharacterized membrane protein YphA (DoxX/SURF4 family)